MPALSPIYTADNCKAAYQLNWSLALFWREPIQQADWLVDLQHAAEADGVRILQHRFVHDGRCMEIRNAPLRRMRDMILAAAGKKGHLLSTAAVVPDHIHLTLGCHVSQSPAEVALSYMNNLAYVCGMKWVFAFGFYVGTFGEYDLGVTWL